MNVEAQYLSPGSRLLDQVFLHVHVVKIIKVLPIQSKYGRTTFSKHTRVLVSVSHSAPALYLSFVYSLSWVRSLL